ncbi:MAG: histidinol-phosphate transaminase [Roseburia sp.]
MKKWEENIRKVVPYVPGEQPNKQNMIKLNTNENPYPPAPGVVKAMQKFDTDRLRLYPDPTAHVLVKAIADRYGLPENQVFVGVGSDDVLAMCFMTFFNSKKPLLFPDITYSFYDVWAEEFRIPYEQIPLDEDFQICPADYNRENGGIIFPNPNAPTGNLMLLEQIEEMIKNNPDVIVIVDEAYIDFGGVSALPLIQEYDNVLIVQTFSKSRSMAGMRIGYVMAQPELIKYLNDVKYSFNSYTMNQLTITMGAAAVEDEAYFKETTAKIIATRERTKEELKKLGYVFGDSMSNFLFVTHPTLSMEKLFEDLKKKDIYVRHFNSPERIRNYLRISIGTDQEMDTLLEFLREYR